MKYIEKIVIQLMVLMLFTAVIGSIPASATWVVFDNEYINPVTGMWVGGDGSGTLTSSRDTATFKNGAAAIKWNYTFGVTTDNNWPTIELLNGNQNWSGATSLGMWLYFDLTSTKTDWTIEPALMHPFPTGDVLGNWNSGPTGVPNNTWIWHEWAISTSLDISNVSHVRLNYHVGDGWVPLAKSGQINIYVDDISLGGLNEPPTNANFKVFDMEGSNPVTGSWGAGAGTQTTSISGTFAKHGAQALRWRYTYGAVTGGNFPTIEMAVPTPKNRWIGATKLGVWMLFDLTGPKTGWTIQPNLQHPWPTGNDLGNWNDGSFGVPQNEWVWHEWAIDTTWDLTTVSHLRFYYHDGDGWAGLAKSNNVDIYLDDISINVVPTPVELSRFSAEAYELKKW